MSDGVVWASVPFLRKACQVCSKSVSYKEWLQVFCMAAGDTVIRGGILDLPEGSVLLLHDCADVVLEDWTISGVCPEPLYPSYPLRCEPSLFRHP